MEAWWLCSGFETKFDSSQNRLLWRSNQFSMLNQISWKQEKEGVHTRGHLERQNKARKDGKASISHLYFRQSFRVWILASEMHAKQSNDDTSPRQSPSPYAWPTEACA